MGIMPEQIETIRQTCTPKVNIAVNAVDNGYVIQGEVQWFNGENLLATERRSAVASDNADIKNLVDRFLRNRNFTDPGYAEPGTRLKPEAGENLQDLDN